MNNMNTTLKDLGDGVYGLDSDLFQIDGEAEITFSEWVDFARGLTEALSHEILFQLRIKRSMDESYYPGTQTRLNFQEVS